MFCGHQQCAPFKRLLTTDSTATSFASKVPTITEPTGDGVLDLTTTPPNGQVPTAVRLIPISDGDDDATFEMRVIGWQRIGSGQPVNTVKPLWVPVPLAQFAVTLCTAVGVANAAVVATERFADTIALASVALQPKTVDTDSGGAASSGQVHFVTVANNLIAMVVVPLYASEKLEITFDSTAASTVNGMNCLYSLLS